MTANELATFLREEVPHLRSIPKSSGRLPRHIDEIRVEALLSALDAAVGLLKRAHDDLEDADFMPGDGSCMDDLRLVKETP